MCFFLFPQSSQLYYDANTGMYYYYDTESGKYQFHSRIEVPTAHPEVEQTPQRKTKDWKNRKSVKNTDRASCPDGGVRCTRTHIVIVLWSQRFVFVGSHSVFFNMISYLKFSLSTTVLSLSFQYFVNPKHLSGFWYLLLLNWVCVWVCRTVSERGPSSSSKHYGKFDARWSWSYALPFAVGSGFDLLIGSVEDRPFEAGWSERYCL